MGRSSVNQKEFGRLVMQLPCNAHTSLEVMVCFDASGTFFLFSFFLFSIFLKALVFV